METLEQLVELTQNLFECDRDEMYYHLLQLCGKLTCILFHFQLGSCFVLKELACIWFLRHLAGEESKSSFVCMFVCFYLQSSA